MAGEGVSLVGTEDPLAECWQKGWKSGLRDSVSEQGVWLLSVTEEGELEGFQAKMRKRYFRKTDSKGWGQGDS